MYSADVTVTYMRTHTVSKYFRTVRGPSLAFYEEHKSPTNFEI